MNGSDFVAGHLNFGDDHDVVGGGEGDQFFHFGLGVEPGTGIEHVVHGGAGAALGHEARIFFDLDAPSLIVDEVEVQGVEFVARHLGDDLFESGEGDEGATGVDHEFANGSARCVGNEQRRELCGLRGEQLVERHEPVVDPGGRTTDDADALLIDSELIAFGVADSGGVDRKLQCGVAAQHIDSGALTQDATRHSRLVVEGGGSFDATDARKHERGAGTLLELGGQGDKCIFLGVLLRAQTVGFGRQIGSGHAVEGGKTDHLGAGAGEVDFLQTGAAVEGSGTDLFDTRGKGDFGQTAATQEGLVPDFAQLGRENDATQVAAAEKGIVGDFSDVGLTEVELLELRTEVAQLSEIAIASSGEGSAEGEFRDPRFLRGGEVFELLHADEFRDAVGHGGGSGLRTERQGGAAAQGEKDSFHGKGFG